MTTSATLYRAADLIAQSGLWKYGQERRGQHCTLTAISAAATSRRETLSAIRPLYDFLGLSSIAEWNDAPDRTAAEVVSMLRTVAAEQEVTEQAERITSAAAESVTA